MRFRKKPQFPPRVEDVFSLTQVEHLLGLMDKAGEKETTYTVAGILRFDLENAREALRKDRGAG